MTLPLVLTAYGLPHLMGYLKTRNGEACPSPLSLAGLMDLAVDLGLAGVEFPLRAIDAAAVPEIKDALESRGLRAVIDYMMILNATADDLVSVLHGARELGSPVVRTTLSGILCGDRRNHPGGWETQMQALAGRLNEVLPRAEELGMCIAVENHQDATSEDLLRLSEMTGHSPAYGVTLDTGNPLAVGEGPVEYASRIAPLIRHLHLKDYTIHFAPEGYRLVRCAAGDGVIDFPAILKIVATNGHVVLPGNEIAAQPTRTIPVLEDSWWGCYPAAQSTRLPEALRVLWSWGRPADEPYSSAWERGEDSAIVAADELNVVRRSISYFSTIMND